MISWVVSAQPPVANILASAINKRLTFLSIPALGRGLLIEAGPSLVRRNLCSGAIAWVKIFLDETPG